MGTGTRISGALCLQRPIKVVQTPTRTALRAQLRPGPLPSTQLRKDGQTWVNISRVIQLSVHQFDPTGHPGWRTLKLLFNALMASISVSVRSKEVQFRLDSSLSAVFVLGTTAMPLCVAQRRRTWAGSVPVLSSCHALHGE
jgi:hypothetical protein